MAKDTNDTYEPKEAQRRFEAALRGARIAGHKPMSDVAPKRLKGKEATVPKNRRPFVKSEP
jgi:hypothetical protein